MTMWVGSVGFADSPSQPLPSLPQLFAVMDPVADPGVAYFARQASRSDPVLSDLLRWSVQATVDAPYEGDPRLSLSGRLSVPADPRATLSEQLERSRLDRAIAVLQQNDLERGYAYGVLELLCRWGYLRSVATLLSHMANLEPHAAHDWRARAESVTWEQQALAQQIDAHAPRVLELTAASPDFVCRVPSIGPLDIEPELHDHPDLLRLALEQEREAQSESFLSGVGSPEWTIDGSLRYSAGIEPVQGDIRIALTVPISLPGATASAGLEADLHSFSASLRVSGDRGRPSGVAPDSSARTHARDIAALRLRVAGARASVQDARLEWKHALGALPEGDAFLDPACSGLCPLPTRSPSTLDGALARMDALAIAWRLARAKLDLLRSIAAEPHELAITSQWAPNEVDVRWPAEEAHPNTNE